MPAAIRYLSIGVLLWVTCPATAANEHFAWSATCTVNCNAVGIGNGSAVGGVLLVDSASTAPLSDISAAAIIDFRFTLGNVTMTSSTHSIVDTVDANVSANGESIDMRLLQAQPIDLSGPNYTQQTNGVWNAFPIGGVFILGINGDYERVTIVDTDGDLVGDNRDNCTLVSNPRQRDSNGDGYGNYCDADLSNDRLINATDLGLLKLVFFSGDPDADFNGDGVVNAQDLGVLKASFFGSPGPSALAP